METHLAGSWERTMFKKRQTAAIAVAALLSSPIAHAQANLTAETASPGSTPGISVIALFGGRRSEQCCKYSGERWTNFNQFSAERR